VFAGVIVMLAAATTVSVSVATALCGTPLESDTRIVSKSMLVVCVGVPLITPVVGFSVKPAGSAPFAIAHVYGPFPPETVSVAEYEALTRPFGKDPMVIVTGPTPGALLQPCSKIAKSKIGIAKFQNPLRLTRA
jgi:hypothetical protein